MDYMHNRRAIVDTIAETIPTPISRGWSSRCRKDHTLSNPYASDKTKHPHTCVQHVVNRCLRILPTGHTENGGLKLYFHDLLIMSDNPAQRKPLAYCCRQLSREENCSKESQDQVCHSDCCRHQGLRYRSKATERITQYSPPFQIDRGPIRLNYNPYFAHIANRKWKNWDGLCNSAIQIYKDT